MVSTSRTIYAAVTIALSGRVAELADAQDSGSCVRKDVGVQLPPRPPGVSATNGFLTGVTKPPIAPDCNHFNRTSVRSGSPETLSRG